MFFFFFRKVLKTGEMLNMLNILKPVGRNGAFDPQRFNIFNISPVLGTFRKNRGNVKYVKYVKSVGRNGASDPKRFNIFNISPVLSTFREKTFNISPVS